MDNEPTERDKYVKGLEDRISKAGRARRFMGSEDGALVTEWVQKQVNGFIKALGGTKYMNDLNMANFDRGQLAFAQKLLAMLNKEAGQDTTELSQQLKDAKDDAGPVKQQSE